MNDDKRAPIAPRRQQAGVSLLALALLATPALSPAATNKPRGSGPAVKAPTPVTLNFVNADIEAVTRAMGVMMNRQFIIDPRVKGQITVYSEQPVTPREAYLNYLAALRGLGFTVVESAGLWKVVPEADAKLQAGSVAVDSSKERGDQILTQVYRLNFENANNLVAVLRPLISPNNTINANPGNNSLVITDYADNLQRLGRIIAAMDTAGATDIELVPLKHAVAADLAPLVLRLTEAGNAAAAVPGQGGSGSVNVVVDPRSNALIVRAANPTRLAYTKSIIAKLDQPSLDNSPAGNIRVIYLKNADATKLATVLRAAFSANSNAGGASGSNSGAGQSGAGGLGAGNFSGLQQSGAGSGNNSSTSGSGASAAATTPVSASAGPSTGGFVQADPSTNALIITAAEPLYRQIRQVVEQLDGRRAQIYVETLIVKVDASKSGNFGVQWQNLFGNKGDSSITGAGTNFGTGPGNIIQGSAALYGGTTAIASVIKDAPTGFNIGLLKKFGERYTLGAIANFLETEAGANVLSTPNLVALDNEEAKIVVGRSVPFVTGSYTNTGSGSGTGAVNPFQTYDRKDVGITLRIRSQIGEGGTVRMTVFQENSSVDPTTKADSSGPSTEKSSIETTVSVDDGQILVLGGLLKDEFADSEGRVPGLGSLPLIGNLFKNTGRSRVKTNLMVFLRPVIMRSQEAADRITLDRYDHFRTLQESVKPESKFALPDTGTPLLPANPTAPIGVAKPPAGATDKVGQ
ncbi:type II secretion system secretin GspD [Paucibacter sp. DJ2R-2]|uniref:type II secretion system secretin GspD n=1 Tax=Paucibacter sp. DJ2R-2 TaxID=2893558 RepID=UPI0021E3C18B|nr:type II secretion system secretin GspD [Paucibacter sp. DJ2R-2]MCV2421927.1 type II secretion system secretin GspD [Paucibacter sp. DJ4R-1]MCV2439456.1 type II secretion system secretin GspD [Paucibacter sp. DJ2R-2]